MNRKKFLRKSTLGLSSIIAIPTFLGACEEEPIDPSGCGITPTEIAGPFPIKTPADWVRENIVGDRSGVALMITFKVENTNDDCSPLADAFVDLWHCDAKGNYSEYDGQIDGNFTNAHFLRGRQTTDVNGNASFISIYPGWYPGRAPHLHVEVLRSDGSSLLTTQVAFPEDVSTDVYATPDYSGDFDTSNSRDGAFRDTLALNMADSVTGNTTDGYVLTKTLKVAG